VERLSKRIPTASLVALWPQQNNQSLTTQARFSGMGE